MIETIGIKPISAFTPTLIGEIKQSLFLFNTIGIPRLSIGLEHQRKFFGNFPQVKSIITSLEELQDKGVLKSVFESPSYNLKPTLNQVEFDKEFEFLSNQIQNGGTEIGLEAAARLSCLVHNNELNSNSHAIPLIKNLSVPADSISKQTEVINLIISKFPIPDQNTPIENVLSFKKDTDNIGRIYGLRTWINNSLNSEKNIQEINEELEFLLYQYSKSLELHKIKYTSGNLKSILKGSAFLMENLAKLKFTNIVDGLYSMQEQKVELLKTELTSPGNELSYIYMVKESFR